MQRPLRMWATLLPVLMAVACHASAEGAEHLNAAAKRAAANYQFMFDFFTGTHAEPSPNGFQVPGNIDTNPWTAVLEGEGNSANLLNLGPCAGNSPHHHPRGVEVSTVIRGTVQFGYVEENAGKNRLVVVDAKPGQVVFIPQGLTHFTHNQECSPASFLANFGTRDQGTVTAWASLMAVPTPILAAALNIADTQEESERIINGWKQRQLVHAPATGGAECLKRCYISYQQANNFTDSPAQLARSNGPIVPKDQKGNPQSFAAGGVNVEEKRCDFLGLTSLPGEPAPLGQQCATGTPTTHSNNQYGGSQYGGSSQYSSHNQYSSGHNNQQYDSNHHTTNQYDNKQYGNNNNNNQQYGNNNYNNQQYNSNQHNSHQYQSNQYNNNDHKQYNNNDNKQYSNNDNKQYNSNDKKEQHYEAPKYDGSYYRKLQEIGSKLPQDRITVMDAAEVDSHASSQ